MRFAYRLAREVGHTVRVRRMLRSMTAKDFLYWEAYYALEPSLDLRIDWLTASIREMLFNLKVGPKHRKPIKDFLVKFGDHESEQPAVKKQTWQQQKAMMMMVVAAHNRKAK